MSTDRLPAPTAAYLASPAFAGLWDAVKARLESNGVIPKGTVRIPVSDQAQSEALTGLLGRSVRVPVATVSLAALDSSLRASAAGMGLVGVVTALRGAPHDRRAARLNASAARESLWARFETAVSDAGLAGEEWVPAWAEDLRRTGLLSRMALQDASVIVGQAVRVLAVTGQGVPTGRSDLAAAVTGSAHGLDDGTVLTTAVLRGLAARSGVAFPSGAAQRRDLWESSGVSVDAVSSTVLTYGLGGVGRMALMRAERVALHLETHLALRELRAHPLACAPGRRVLVCENPRVLAAVADAGLEVAVVCGFGNPNTAVLTALAQLSACGGALYYHGDFDWGGVRIANRMRAEAGCVPWRMSSADYGQWLDAGVATSRLDGVEVPASWDDDLSRLMARQRAAVHEEALLPRLLDGIALDFA